MFGYWLGRNQGLWDELLRLRWHSLGLAIICYAIYAPIVLRWEGPDFGGVPLLAMRWLSGLNT